MTAPGRQGSLSTTQKGELLTSAIFVVETADGTCNFSELTGITSEVEGSEYMESTAAGPLFSRHLGRTKPPTVTLKRALSSGKDSTWIWSWHQLARGGGALAYKDCTLKLFAPGDDTSSAAKMSYTLVNAWPTKVEVTGMKAGASEVVMQTVVLQCDEIVDLNAKAGA